MGKQVYGNRYQITERIGMGGMAEVYKAVDSTLGRPVALKVMLPQYAQDRTFAARFRQEAQAAANLQSPYIVNIYDWGRDGDSYYIVMEYVRGTDLKTALQQRGRIHPRKVAEIASQVCDALSVAHGYDVIHRDIKSANIMVKADGNVKVMDFGIAQAGNTGMTEDSSVLGTAHYVSPEQAQGKQLDAASDLYSLGVVMYEAATGQLPFDGPDVVSVAMKQVREMPVPPREINPEIDPRLEAIIMRALQKNPKDRYATANEMKQAIDDYLRGGSVARTQVIGAAAQNNGTATDRTVVMNDLSNNGTNYHNRNQGTEEEKPNTGKRILIALLILLVLAGAGYAIANFTGILNAQISVPELTNMTQEEASKALTDAHLKIGVVDYEASDTVEEGKVCRQDPAANSSASSDTAVNIWLSTGKAADAKVSVPQLVGLSASDAEKALSEKGLKSDPQQGYNENYEEGKVYEQSPAALTEVTEGSTITYYVSKGKEQESVKVANVVGWSEADATATLENQGLVVTVEEGSSDSVGQGEVFKQSIQAGTEVAAGTSITITVSTGSTSITVPDVMGQTKSTATAALKNKGFKVSTNYAPGSEGEVIAQSPDAGDTAKKGDTVTITIGTGIDDEDEGEDSSSTSSNAATGTYGGN